MLNRQEKLHFIGIGGIGMSGIAEVLLKQGYSISGSDIASSAITKKLEQLGAKIFLGHNAEHINDAVKVVFSSAVSSQNSEILRARECNIPILKRAEVLAELLHMKKGVAVAGTHGKTTTTSILATILRESKLDPTYVIGGNVHNLDGHAKVGKGDYFVAEADESDGSFLLLRPTMVVVTNIDSDHLDFYKSKEALETAFFKFIDNVPSDGRCTVNIHDSRLVALAKKSSASWVSFGLQDHCSLEADYAGVNLVGGNFCMDFDFYYRGKKICPIHLSVPGRHNVLNALGAISMAHMMGVSFKNIQETISSFTGVQRRMQVLFQRDHFEIIDDYAHHPTEIKATLEAIANMHPHRRIVTIFEPHRFSRTRHCWQEFYTCFQKSHKLYLCPVYPAGEEKIEGITSEKLTFDIGKRTSNKPQYIENANELFKILDLYKNENVVLTSLGAGHIGKQVRKWVQTNG